ncbi:MAG: rRNA maturation RNase YbeY [Planctomycetaceae bacterium]|nr:rRNA maturation RNase YbeY [Planctomycetaceae bacterium]
MNSSYEIDISWHPGGVQPDRDRLQSALTHGLREEGVASAVISVSVVDNDVIHRINREHLQHDYPTDVISFGLELSGTQEESTSAADGRARGACVEGEIVVSAEYAEQTASRCGWTAMDELTLYVIHGMLHLCGYDDLTAEEKSIMRARERHILSGLGLSPRYPDE